MPAEEQIPIEIGSDFILVTLSCPELDDDLAEALEAKVSRAAGDASHLPVVLDLSQVEQIADDSLGALVDLRNDCRERSQAFILAGLRPAVLEVLSVTKLGKLFEYREDVEDALSHLREVDKSQE